MTNLRLVEKDVLIPKLIRDKSRSVENKTIEWSYIEIRDLLIIIIKITLQDREVPTRSCQFHQVQRRKWSNGCV